MRASLAAIVFLMSATGLAWGQAAPGPEIQKLGYYVGSWEGHGETRAGPFGPAGKLSSRQTCDWFSGGFQVVCRGEEHGPTGARNFLNLLSYDPKARAYTQYSISSRGETEYDPGGALAGNTMTYILEQNVGGKHARFRYTEVRVSPVLYTYRAEVSLAGGPWTVLATGEIRKIK